MPIDLIGKNNAVLPDNLSSLFRASSIIPQMTRYLSNYQTPESGENGYIKGNVIRIRLPASFIDFNRANLQFTTTISANASTYIRHRWNIGTCFSLVRVLIGSTEISQTQNFALIDSIVELSKTESYINSVGKQLRGLGDATARNAQANSGVTYCLYLGDTIKLLSQALPLYKIQEVMTLEFTVNDLQCLETDGTNPQLTINNVKFHYDTIQISPEIDNMITQKINDKLCIPYLQYDYFNNTQMTNGINSMATQLPFRQISLAGVLAVARNSANLSNPAINDTYNSFLGYSNFVSDYLKFNNVIMPNDKCDSQNDQLTLTLEFFGKCLGNSDVYFCQDWANKFIMAFSLMQDSKQAYEPSETTVQGVSGSSSGMSLIHNLQLSANAVNLQLDYFSLYYGCIRINPNGTITYSS